MQTAVHQGSNISLAMRGSQTLGSGVVANIGLNDLRISWGNQAGANNANQVGNQGYMFVAGSFSTNSVAGSQFQIQCKGNQATVTPTAYQGSWAKYTKIA